MNRETTSADINCYQIISQAVSSKIPYSATVSSPIGMSGRGGPWFLGSRMTGWRECSPRPLSCRRTSRSCGESAERMNALDEEDTSGRIELFLLCPTKIQSIVFHKPITHSRTDHETHMHQISFFSFTEHLSLLEQWIPTIRIHRETLHHHAQNQKSFSRVFGLP